MLQKSKKTRTFVSFFTYCFINFIWKLIFFISIKFEYTVYSTINTIPLGINIFDKKLLGFVKISIISQTHRKYCRINEQKKTIYKMY
jgi:hypothetical protein